MIALYHGTTTEVAAPLVKLGRKRVDFGQGFYLTKLKRQASLWAETIAERRMADTPILNTYEFGNSKIPTDTLLLSIFLILDIHVLN